MQEGGCVRATEPSDGPSSGDAESEAEVSSQVYTQDYLSDISETVSSSEEELYGVRNKPKKAIKKTRPPKRGTTKSNKSLNKVSIKNKKNKRAIKYEVSDESESCYEDEEDLGDGFVARGKEVFSYEIPFVAEEDIVPVVEKILGTKSDQNTFLVRWRGKSLDKSTWETRSVVCEHGGAKKLDLFLARQAIGDDDDPLISTSMERVIDHKRNFGKDFYLAKWCLMPYSDCTWEAESDVPRELLDQFISRSHTDGITPSPKNLNKRCKLSKKFTEAPSYLAKYGTLRSYQIDSLNWLVHSWIRGVNVMLADEMGLGKTVQSIAYVSALVHEFAFTGPVLIVVPLSTIAAWQRECSRWIPGLNTLVYIGDAKSRGTLRFYEWFPRNSESVLKKPTFHILITTYELVMKDKIFLAEIDWRMLIVDEGHRLKNSSSQLHEALKDLAPLSRLLVTGTPLQNSLEELWSLLNFLDPLKFPSYDDFIEDYSIGQGQSEDENKRLEQLHNLLKPHILRRMKRDVEKSLPSKTERILRVDMTAKQASLSRFVLTRNYAALVAHGKNTGSLSNILMELKKIANHPSLSVGDQDLHQIDDLNDPFVEKKPSVHWVPDQDDDRPLHQIEKIGTTNDTAQSSDGSGKVGDLDTDEIGAQSNHRHIIIERLCKASGKLDLLDKLMLRLVEGKHRVLIFSQMVRMLDILEKYVQLRGWSYQRLDGSTPSDQRIRSISSFNDPESKDFCFLLSTRAGGLGINLETADTVILYDSDWNPQNDLQAIARVHRIGQTKSVNIYRLVTRHSVEENVLERAKQKMVLDQLVIQSMSGVSGAKSIGKDEIQAILKFSAQHLFTNSPGSKSNDSSVSGMTKNDLDDILARATNEDPEHDAEAGSSFFDQFKVADVGFTAPSWDEIIPESKVAATKLELAEEEQRAKEILLQEALLTTASKRAGRKKMIIADSTEAGKNEQKHRSNLNKVGGMDVIRLSKQATRHLIAGLMSFGTCEERFPLIFNKVCQDFPDVSEQQVKQVIRIIERQIEDGECADETFQLGNGFNVNLTKLRSRCVSLNNLCRLIQSDSLKIKPGTVKSVSQAGASRWRIEWKTPDDDLKLLKAVYKNGYGEWKKISTEKGLEYLRDCLENPDTLHLPREIHVARRVDNLLSHLLKEFGTTISSHSVSCPIRPLNNNVLKKTKSSADLESKKNVQVVLKRKKERIGVSDEEGGKKLKSMTRVNKSSGQISIGASNSREKPDSDKNGEFERIEKSAVGDFPKDLKIDKVARKILKPVREEIASIARLPPDLFAENINLVSSALIKIGILIEEVAGGNKDDESRYWSFVASFWPVQMAGEELAHYYVRIKEEPKCSPGIIL